MKTDANDKHYATETIISNTLRFGVWISLVLIAAGCLLNFVFRPEYSSSPEHLRTLIAPDAGDVFRYWRHLDGTAVLVTGLVLLISTPVLRVATSLVLFVLEKDRIYTIVTAIVLALLLLCFVLGKAA